MQCPKLILLFSGKRKSGKDFICEQLRDKYHNHQDFINTNNNYIIFFLRLNGENETTTCTILRISEPLKSLYANEHNLDLVDLMSAGPYKEHYRLAMINWSDRIRENDPGYFCRAACTTTNCSNNKQLLSSTIWIFSDIRRKTDIEWFKDNYGDEIIRTVRVNADVTTRVDRGWVFTKG